MFTKIKCWEITPCILILLICNHVIKNGFFIAVILTYVLLKLLHAHCRTECVIYGNIKDTLVNKI